MGPERVIEPPRPGPRRAGPWSIALLLGGASALLAATLWSQLHNTLHDNGRWLSAKTGLALGVPGAVSFLVTRNALHRNRLDLGAWHGHQELLWHEPLLWHEIAFDFQLGRPGYLVALFEKADGAFRGRSRPVLLEPPEPRSRGLP